MNLSLSRFFKRVFSTAAATPKRVRQPQVVPSRRSFTGAKVNRLNQDFVSTAIKTNKDIQDNLDVLRTRSRELAKNSSDYRKFLAMTERNIVGSTGFTLQSNIRMPRGKPDKTANDYWETRWAEFSATRQCTCDRTGSLRDFLKTMVRNWRIDGEVFVRLVRGFGNDSRFALQLLDPAACPSDFNAPRGNGRNKVESGIELDEWNAPIAYWFRSAVDASDYSGYEPLYNPRPGQEYLRLPAGEVIHLYTKEFANQRRGFPFGQSAMQCIYTLGAYFYTELVAADVASRKMGFYIPPAGLDLGGREDPPEGEDEMDDAEPMRPDFLQEAEPGALEMLGNGWDFKSWDPNHPHSNFEMFTKNQKRNIANGLDVAYNIFANDLEGVNYSSIRQGITDERDAWKDLQQVVIDNVLNPVYRVWMLIQLTRDAKYSVLDLDRLCRPVWRPRRWPWVDPEKDIDAARKGVALGAATPQQIAADAGGDFDENLEQIKEAAAKFAEVASLLKDVGALDTALGGKPAPAAAAPPEDPPAE